MRLFVVLLVASCGVLLSSAKVQNGDANLASGSDDVTDEKVRKALFGEEEGVDLKEFTMEYLINNKLQLGLQEASMIMDQLTDKDTGSQAEFLKALAKLYELANVLKIKMNGCPSDRDRKLTDVALPKPGPVAEVRERIVQLLDGFNCAKLAKPAPVVSQADIGGPNRLFSSFDYSMMDDLKNKMKNDPMSVYKMILGYLKTFGLISKESSPMVTLVAEQILSHPELAEYGVSLIEAVEMFMKSESGKRFVQIIPQLMAADTETALELFAREADYNQEAFFALLQNGDVAAKFLKSVARIIMSGSTMAKEALADNMKLAVANGFLISNGFPAIAPRNLLKSTCAIVEKCFRVFSTFRFELDLYKEVRAFTDEFESLYFKFDKFVELTDTEVENMLGKFLNDNLLEPLQDAWLGSRHVTVKDPRCGEVVMCLYNERAQGQGEIVKGVTKGLSMLMAYSWMTYDEDVDGMRLYAAIYNGQDVQGKKCKDVYVASPPTCDVFSMKKKQLAMSLEYEHNEL